MAIEELALEDTHYLQTIHVKGDTEYIGGFIYFLSPNWTELVNNICIPPIENIISKRA
jgi:hypothetical protein